MNRLAERVERACKRDNYPTEKEAEELRKRYQDDNYFDLCKTWADEENHPYS